MSIRLNNGTTIADRDDWAGNPLGLDCIIRGRDGILERRVLNLGWLLRHNEEVFAFVVRHPAYTEPGFRNREERTTDCCYMVALMHDGRAFETNWADASICRDWLRRPRFRGLPLNWYGEPTSC